MFSVILTFTAAIIFVAGILLNQNHDPEDLFNDLDKTQVLSEETQNDDQQKDKIDQSDIQIVGEDSLDSVTHNSEQDQLQKDSASNVRLDQFIYPNSSVTSRTDDQLIIESFDDPKQITDWYKQRLESYDMNINSFVTTKTNGNIINQLVSSDGVIEIKVKIESSAEENKVIIEINTL